MAESIITLGIGATPVSLTPFITSGLLLGAAVVVTPIGLTTKARDFSLTTDERDFGLTTKARDFSLTTRSKD